MKESVTLSDLSYSALPKIRKVAERDASVKYLDRIANIAIIVAVVVFLSMVLRGQLHPFSRPRPLGGDLTGRMVKLPGIKLPQDRDSLLLAISTNCHFCRDSLPFYRRLSDAGHGHVNIVAVLPQSESEGREYFQAASIRADQFVSLPLDTIGVRGTPTVLLLDSSGRIKKAWIGRLDQAGQDDLLKAAHITPVNLVGSKG